MNRKIKILFAVNRFYLGGAERLVINEIKHLNKDLFDPWLVTVKKETSISIADEIPLGKDRFIQFNFQGPKSGLFDIFSWIKLYKFLKRNKFDAVLSNLFLANLIVRLTAWLARVPIIIIYEPNAIPDRKKWQILINRFLAKHTDKIMASSHELVEEISLKEGIPKEKYLVNYSSPTLTSITLSPEQIKEVKEKLSLPPDGFIITGVGRLVEQKGFMYLVEAADEVLKEKPEKKIYFTIFGVGILKNKLKERINELKLNNRVLLSGLAPMEHIMAITDIFAMPELYDGLALAILEAMSVGKPVIVSKVSGPNEAIEDNVNGLFVEPKNSHMLAEKILKLIKDENLRKRLGERAREDAKKFSIENHVKIIENAILSLLPSKNIK